MTEKIQINEVFDKEVVSLTKSLTGIHLKQVPASGWKGREIIMESIHTKGNFDALIVCQIEQKLFEDIILRMNGGSLPPEREIALYINEYMNIICGRAVSVINNLTGNASRLSLPTFHGNVSEAPEEIKKQENILLYESEEGLLRFVVRYTFH